MRFEVKSGEHTFEVDDFFEKNEDLIIAEVELKPENEAFEKLNWLGKEVTRDVKHYNSQLSKQPFKNWKK